jgi:hypothetical protein
MRPQSLPRFALLPLSAVLLLLDIPCVVRCGSWAPSFGLDDWVSRPRAADGRRRVLAVPRTRPHQEPSQLVLRTTRGFRTASRC